MDARNCIHQIVSGYQTCCLFYCFIGCLTSLQHLGTYYFMLVIPSDPQRVYGCKYPYCPPLYIFINIAVPLFFSLFFHFCTYFCCSVFCHLISKAMFDRVRVSVCNDYVKRGESGRRLEYRAI